MIRLVQEYGAHAGKEYSFDRERVRVGRGPENDVAFDPVVDLDASGRHCEIVFEQGSWWIRDLKSRNGTFVNGQRADNGRLVRGDIIECGRGGPRLRVEQASTGTSPAVLASVAPVGSGPLPPMAPMVQRSPVAAAPVPVVKASAMPEVPLSYGAPLAGSSPAPGPERGATVAMSQIELPGASGLQHGPTPGGSVGRRTVSLMIEESLARAKLSHASGTRRLKALVAVLTLIAASAIGAAVWFYLDGDDNEAPVLAGGTDASNTGARIATANEGNVYILAIDRANTLRGFCTGVAVTTSLIATNAHCVHNANDELTRGGQLVVLRNKSSGTRITARPVYADARFRDGRFSSGGSGYDIGLVRVATALQGYVRLASDAQLGALHEGDAIFVYGFPGMTMNVASPVATITLGLLNRVTDFFDRVGTPATAQKLQHSAQTSGGSSGSAIFTPDGVLIGLNAGSLADDERQVVVDPNNGQRREVEVNRGSNFKYGMRADLIRQGLAALGERAP